MIRPEALATLTRWRDIFAAAGLAAMGLWVFWLGGPILGTIGLALIALAVGLGVSGWRRMRFVQGVTAPGLVEVIEGEVRYFGPNTGGAVSLVDLTELRLITMRGRRLWRLKQADGQALLIPVDAAGAEALFDGFTTLPGLDMAAVLAALETRTGPGSTDLIAANQPDMVVIWRRKGKGLVA